MPRLLAKQLSDAGAQVAIVVDEREGSEDCAPYPKLSLEEKALAALGLTGLPENWGWLCGDMCYYVAAATMPGFSRYVLIESDVFLPALAVEPLIERLVAHPAQVMAAQLGLAAKPKRYSRGLQHFGIDPRWGCIFPLTSVQSEVIEAMRELRLAQLKRFPDAMLNDEGILAGVVAKHGFSYAALEDVVPAHVGAETFNTNPPHLFEALRDDGQERRVFHPVVEFHTVLSRLANGEKAYTRRRLRNVIRTAPEDMRNELLRRL
ncbi:hypothetical protein [Ruegeria atlantica]|uniref:hypothetical protein n=1 Tax=Ruegeria atlantica TaxID=81569 RepID=UPI0014800DF9|nr:hypothetical protein [Ruegeria atlantica]